jgi:acetyl esterase/lipase
LLLIELNLITMNHLKNALPILFLLAFFSNTLLMSQSQKELPLWPDGIPNNPVKYAEEKVRKEEAHASSPSQKNRVFSNVSNPTYLLFQPKKNKANGIAMVICPGGGFRDVWYDAEGIDFALWLAEQGITSLVLKYRTFNKNEEGFSLERNVYNGEVYADAKQAIFILRSQAEELNIDKNKIGIGGFSAGGALSLYASLEIYENVLPEYADFNQSTLPNFTCLVYPAIRDTFFDALDQKDNIPPMFMVNGVQDNITPANKSLRFYSALLENNIPAELHVYSIGKHGFHSGIGRGFSVSGWRDSFLLWLKDMKLLE